MPNTQIDTIILPVDGSTGSLRAAKLAATLAHNAHVPLEIVFAFPRDALEMFGPPGVDSGNEHLQYMAPGAFEELRKNRAGKVFQRARQEIADFVDLDISEQVVNGQPAQAILKHVETKTNPMIVIGSRGASAFRELMLGSVSQKLVHHARCPVTVVH